MRMGEIKKGNVQLHYFLPDNLTPEVHLPLSTLLEPGYVNCSLNIIRKAFPNAKGIVAGSKNFIALNVQLIIQFGFLVDA